ncbi:Caspase-like domain, partial [Trinorchestia longiramus]
FYSADMKLVDVRDIWIKLTDQNCPALKDKPKILFLNYCRGETKQTNRFFDNISETEEDAPKDVALVNASLPGFKAQRLPTEGTVFIHSLCQVLCESVCEKDIHDII